MTQHKMTHHQIKPKSGIKFAAEVLVDEPHVELAAYRSTDWFLWQVRRGLWKAARLQRKDDEQRSADPVRLVVASNYTGHPVLGINSYRVTPGTLNDRRDRFAHISGTRLEASSKAAIYKAVQSHVDEFADELATNLKNKAREEWDAHVAQKMAEFDNYSAADLRDWMRGFFSMSQTVTLRDGTRKSRPRALNGRS